MTQETEYEVKFKVKHAELGPALTCLAQLTVGGFNITTVGNFDVDATGTVDMRDCVVVPHRFAGLPIGDSMSSSQNVGEHPHKIEIDGPKFKVAPHKKRTPKGRIKGIRRPVHQTAGGMHLLRALSTGRCSLKELREALMEVGFASATADARVSDLKKEGLITMVSPQVFELTVAGYLVANTLPSDIDG